MQVSAEAHVLKIDPDILERDQVIKCLIVMSIIYFLHGPTIKHGMYKNLFQWKIFLWMSFPMNKLFQVT